MKKLVIFWMSCLTLTRMNQVAGAGGFIGGRPQACNFSAEVDVALNSILNLQVRTEAIDRLVTRANTLEYCHQQDVVQAAEDAAQSLRHIIREVSKREIAKTGEGIRYVKQVFPTYDHNGNSSVREEAGWENDPKRDEIAIHALNAFLNFVAVFPGVAPNYADSRVRLIENALYNRGDLFFLDPEILQIARDRLQRIQDAEETNSDGLFRVVAAVRQAKEGVERLRNDKLRIKDRATRTGELARKTAAGLLQEDLFGKITVKTTVTGGPGDRALSGYIGVGLKANSKPIKGQRPKTPKPQLAPSRFTINPVRQLPGDN